MSKNEILENNNFENGNVEEEVEGEGEGEQRSEQLNLEPPPLDENEQTNQSSINKKSTLWMGELEYWMDESFIQSIWFESVQEVVAVKLIRDKFSGYSLGYCFVQFSNHETPAAALLNLNNTIIPGTQKIFKLNWASGGSNSHSHLSAQSAPSSYFGPEFSIFVGDLDLEVTDSVLLALFREYYPSVKSAKVVLDMVKGTSKGYGFVRFTDEADQKKALEEMTGKICGSRPIRVSFATPKTRIGQQHLVYHPHQPMYIYHHQQHLDMSLYQTLPPAMDPNLQNTTVFVGGLLPTVTEQVLKEHFEVFGEISYIKIPPKMGCGFVSYVWRNSAETAIQQLSGTVIGGANVRLSWGNSAQQLPRPMYYAPYPPLQFMPYHQHPPHAVDAVEQAEEVEEVAKDDEVVVQEEKVAE